MTTFNKRIYANEILNWIPRVNDHDLAFLCNRAAKIYQKLDDGCVDNFRITRARKILGTWTKSRRYESARDNGCCGYIDQLVHNPLTNHYFFIGFNYGH